MFVPSAFRSLQASASIDRYPMTTTEAFSLGLLVGAAILLPRAQD
jgi:hypothetical protein